MNHFTDTIAARRCEDVARDRFTCPHCGGACDELGMPWHAPVKPLPPQVVRRVLSLESFILGIGVGVLCAAGVLLVFVQ